MDHDARPGRAPSAWALLAILSSLAACGGEEMPPSQGNEASAPGDPGRVVGICRLVGTPTPVRLREWPGMGIEAGQDDESVRTGEGRALAGCVVTLEAGGRSPAPSPPESSLTLTAVAGRFAPHVAVARAPVQVVLESRLAGDLLVHGYEARTRDTAFNLALGPGATLRDAAGLLLSRPGVYHVTDDHGGHFTAWVHVVASAHVDLTTDEARDGIPAGGYRLDRVPPGRHVLRCWHEPMDRRERRDAVGTFHGYVLGPPLEIVRTVEVPSGREVRVDIDVVHPTDVGGPGGR